MDRNEFKKFLSENAGSLIIVKAYADWCAPCKRISPLVDLEVSGLICEHGETNVVLLQINIDDDGPGIADEHKEKVFRPFYRVDKSRSLKDNSVGLGLSIVEDIVNSHGGTVKLLNNPKGKGLRVSLSFPN